MGIHSLYPKLEADHIEKARDWNLRCRRKLQANGEYLKKQTNKQFYTTH